MGGAFSKRTLSLALSKIWEAISPHRTLQFTAGGARAPRGAVRLPGAAPRRAAHRVAARSISGSIRGGGGGWRCWWWWWLALVVVVVVGVGGGGGGGGGRRRRRGRRRRAVHRVATRSIGGSCVDGRFCLLGVKSRT